MFKVCPTGRCLDNVRVAHRGLLAPSLPLRGRIGVGVLARGTIEKRDEP
jgi:hypothetical protein